MRIGFFDSGVGGITVLHQAMEAYPDAEYLYYADTKNVPYGTKSESEIIALVEAAVDFLVAEGVDILVIACNTATSVCITELREQYNIPIVGMEPAVKPASEYVQYNDSPSRILITATKRTLKQKKLNDLITRLNAEDQVTLIALQKLVKLAEKQVFKGSKVKQYLSHKFKNLDWRDYGSIVLGCTHFIYYKQILRKIMPKHIAIIDGNEGTVNRLLHYIAELRGIEKSHSKPKLLYYQSGKKKSKKELKPYLDFLST